MKKKPPPFEWEELLIPAFRYYLGRQTISTCAFADRLAEVWDDIPEQIQRLIRHELDHAFEEDDRSIAMQDGYRPLGSDTDRGHWESVRWVYMKNP